MAATEPLNVTANSTHSKITTIPHSTWHSPVPYLFGGLAAMLGLIAFALLILACSYCKLSGYLENGGEGGQGERDLESGEEGKGNETQKAGSEQKFLVIMAGEVKPTCLATPISFSNRRSSSFGDKSEKRFRCAEKGAILDEEGEKQLSRGTDDHHVEGERAGTQQSLSHENQDH